METAHEMTEALRANTDALLKKEQSLEVFGDKNTKLWEDIERAGLKSEVLALLREDFAK